MLEQGDAARFEAELLRRLPDTDWRLSVDYDPCPLLVEALRAAGIECRGMMFSADGLLPRKTTMLREGGRLKVKCGYGAPFETIPA